MADMAARLVAFGDAIRAQRRARDWSQEQLAEAAGLHRTYIGALERGEQNATVTSVWRIADALGIPPGDLLVEAPRRRR